MDWHARAGPSLGWLLGVGARSLARSFVSKGQRIVWIPRFVSFRNTRADRDVTETAELRAVCDGERRVRRGACTEIRHGARYVYWWPVYRYVGSKSRARYSEPGRGKRLSSSPSPPPPPSFFRSVYPIDRGPASRRTVARYPRLRNANR